MQESSYWKNKTAIVTGAGIGIGFKIAFELASKGTNVIVNDLDHRALQNVKESLSKLDGSCTTVEGDSGDLGTINELINTADSDYGRIDFVVANSGITTYAPFLDYTVDEFQKVTKVNLQGTFFLIQSSAKYMIQKRLKGRIVAMSSVTGHTYHRNLTAYGMTKAGISFLAKSTGVELAPHGITVNAISPGATLTERTSELDEGEFKQIWNKLTPIGKCASVEEIAHTTLFLLSENSGHITGQTIIVDGGWTSYSPQP